MAEIKNKDNIKVWCKWKQLALPITAVGMQNTTITLENSLAISYKLKIYFLHDLVISLLIFIQKK